MTRGVLVGGACLLTIGALFAGRSVWAGVADSPIPLLNGAKAAHVFTVPGVTHTGGMGTVIICTSTEKAKVVTIGIEVFDWDGSPLNDVTADNGVSEIGPGQTRTLETQLLGDGGVNAFSQDKTINFLKDADHASARVLATSKNIACSAIVSDRTNIPPTSMVNLQVVSKLKQKGD